MPLQIVLQGIRGIVKEQWNSGGQVSEHLQAVSRAGVYECLCEGRNVVVMLHAPQGKMIAYHGHLP